MREYRIRNIRYLLFVATMLCVVGPANAQSNSGRTPSSCASMTAVVDGAANLFRERKNVNSKLIVIAGSKSYSNRKSDLARIKQVVGYLGKSYKIYPEEIIYAIGGSRGMLSFMKFYVSGELVGEIRVNSKGSLCRALNERME